MTAFRLTGFQGIRPRVSPRLIDDNVAQVAANCRLSSGEIVPLKQPALVNAPTTQGPLLSIYKADSIWFSWNKDVDVVRSPLPGTLKFIYSGDGEPRITTIALATTGGTGSYPTQARALGIPSPQTAPTVTVTGGSAVAVSRFYCYTFNSDWNEESAPSPLTPLITGKPDGTWSITGFDPSPANSGTGTVSVSSGVTTFTNGSAVKHWLRVGDEVIISGTVVAVSEVVSPTVFKMLGSFTGATSWSRKAPWGSCKKRLYRSTGTTGQFQLVEDNIEASTRWSAGTYTDTLADSAIAGDELISATWQPPPADLKGVIALPSGSIAGFSGNEVCFSEPFQPHAWPPEYRMRSQGYPVVSLGLYTSGIVVGTTGVPLVLLGHEPGQMAAQPAEGSYPCLTKRSMVSLGDKVAYATEHGMATIGDSGVDILTKDWFSRDEWDTYKPETMFSAFIRGRIYTMSDSQGDSPQMLIFDFLDKTGLTTAYINATCLFADKLTGKLYISDATNHDIREFDPPGGLYMQQDWMSKEFVLPEPVNIGAAKVNFDSRFSQQDILNLQAQYDAAVAANTALISSGDAGGQVDDEQVNFYSVNGSDLVDVSPPETESPGVSFTLYVGGKVMFSSNITSSSGFRLPSGYKTDTFAVRVQGQSLVKSIELAETMQGLKGV
jgi:hypothetical protein